MVTRSIAKRTGLLALLMTTTVLAQAPAQPGQGRRGGIAGDWQVTVQFGERQMNAILSLSTGRDGKLTGQVSGEIFDGARKAELLREIAAREGIRLEQVIAVGDGANDLPMLAIAGLGIAFHAKPIVTEQARHSIANVGLDGILYLLGMRDRDVARLM